MKIKSTMILLTVCVIAAGSLLYWFVTTPKANTLQAGLKERVNFDYETSFMIQKDSTLKRLLLLRRVKNSDWQMSGKHTGYKVQTRKEPSMSVSTIRPDAYLMKSTDDKSRIIIGRLTDRGSGMHGWHITMIKQGDTEINIDRHQRYKVWIEKDIPKGFDDQGEPISDNPKRWFFAGLADIIAKEQYDGYVEPAEGDR